MRHVILLAMIASMGLAACERSGEAEVRRAVDDLSLLEDDNLSDMMLTVGDPAEASSYFAQALTVNPDRIDLMRNLATSQIRAGRATEAVGTWRAVAAHPEAANDDQVDLADALIRTNDWAGAATVLNTIPPTHETFKRYRLEAMVADSQENWAKADSFYETAVGLTTTPAGVFNNWGYSKLSRGDYREAERLFLDALRYEPEMFAAKNNLVMARGAQRIYDLPVVRMTQTERAQLLYTLALTAIKQNDVTIGRGLLQEAVETHPQHFEEAARALRALS